MPPGDGRFGALLEEAAKLFVFRFLFSFCGSKKEISSIIQSDERPPLALEAFAV